MSRFSPRGYRTQLGGDRGIRLPAILSLDLEAAEGRYHESLDHSSPDREFDRRWALATLERARTRMGREFALSGKVELFDRLRPYLLGNETGVPYAEIAADLKMTVVGIKVTVHRLRARYAEILRDEIKATLADPADVDTELRHLIQSLS